MLACMYIYIIQGKKTFNEIHQNANNFGYLSVILMDNFKFLLNSFLSSKLSIMNMKYF